MSLNHCKQRVYTVVLTGGPCGGKTTGQVRLATFFESLGWKVYRVPEAATILLGGGVKFAELSEMQAFHFQQDLLRAMMSIENVYFHLGQNCARNCLIICDRGAMDPSAYIDQDKWNRILLLNQQNEVDIRDNRYNQVVHLVTAAEGAEEFYSLENNDTRSEGLEHARHLDKITREAWVGHPYFDIVDNGGTRTFEDKMRKLIQVVCDRAGVHYGDRLADDSRKRKFLVLGFSEERLPTHFQKFEVIHDYLLAPATEPVDTQIRIRKRGKDGKWSYTHTTRCIVAGERVERRMQISEREYEAMRQHRDPKRHSTYKNRFCFSCESQYFQLDVYKSPSPPACNGLMMLETYTTQTGDMVFPECVQVGREVTNDQQYSMYNLSRMLSKWPGSKGDSVLPPDLVNGL